jgi:hypothetical protein
MNNTNSSQQKKREKKYKIISPSGRGSNTNSLSP